MAEDISRFCNPRVPELLATTELRRLAGASGFTGTEQWSRPQLCKLLQWKQLHALSELEDIRDSLPACREQIEEVSKFQKKYYPGAVDESKTIANLREWHRGLVRRYDDMKYAAATQNPKDILQLHEDVVSTCAALTNSIRNRLLTLQRPKQKTSLLAGAASLLFPNIYQIYTNASQQYILDRSMLPRSGELSLYFLAQKHANAACLFTKRGEPVTAFVQATFVPGPSAEHPALWDPRRRTSFAVEFECDAGGLSCTLSVPKNVVEALEACMQDKKKRFYFGTLILAEMTPEGEHQVGHANALVFDRKTKKMERFEPHGGESPYEHRFEHALHMRLRAWAKTLGFTYLSPFSFCPMVGIQTKQDVEHPEYERGFCQTWSLWYMDQRLEHPDVDPSQLQLMMLEDFQKNNQSLTNFIESYALFLSQNQQPSATTNNNAGLRLNNLAFDGYSKKKPNSAVKKKRPSAKRRANKPSKSVKRQRYTK